jgi:hypothetical protein
MASGSQPYTNYETRDYNQITSFVMVDFASGTSASTFRM